MQRAVLKAWSDHRSDGDNTVMLAVTNDTVHALNDAAQAVRVRAGELDWEHSVQARDCWVHVGDEIVTRANDRTLRTDQDVMVRNRAQWTVTDIHGDGSVTARNADGTVRLPADYVSTSVELGYAQTVHGAQGATVDHCLLIVDGPIDGRALYVGMTRGADSNHVYVAVDANHTARDILDAAINADWTDTPAIEIRAELAARPVTPFAPPAASPRIGVLPADELRAVHAEHRSLQALLLPSHEQRLQRLELDDRRRPPAAPPSARPTRRAHPASSPRSPRNAPCSPRSATRHERQDLDRKIKQLHQQRVTAGRDVATMEHRIEQRAADPRTTEHKRRPTRRPGHDLRTRGTAQSSNSG